MASVFTTFPLAYFALHFDMQKFGFRIRTRSGLMVESLLIQAETQALAEIKLRQMYHHATVLECKVLDDLPRGDGTDLEGAISLIISKGD